jgi:hypothetical protein
MRGRLEALRARKNLPEDRLPKFVPGPGVPRLPTFPARWALEDPRGRSYFVFWTDADGKLVHALHMAPADDGRAVAVSTPYALRLRLSVERRHQWGGQVLFYLCPGCHRLRRHLYPWPVIDGRLDRDLKPRCRHGQTLRVFVVHRRLPRAGPPLLARVGPS